MKRTTVKDKVQVNAMKEPVALSKEQERMRRRHGVVIKSSPVPSYDPAEQVEHEQHFTPAQIAKQWGISVYTVRRLFADTPGVLKIGQKGKHVSLRIPGRLLRAYHVKLSACRREVRHGATRGRVKAEAKINIQRQP